MSTFFISTYLIFAPELIIADAVGIAVFETVITSSSRPIPKARRDICIASVPLPTADPYLNL